MKRLLFGLLALFIGFAVFCIIFGAVVWTFELGPFAPDDPSPADDADLRVVRPEIPDEDNAYLFFLQAWEACVWDETDRTLFEQTSHKGSWEQDAVEAFVAKNRDALDLLSEGLARAQCLAPEVTYHEHLEFDLLKMRALSHAACLRALALFRTGHEKEGIDAVLEVARVGHMVQGAKGSLLMYLVGTGIKRFARDAAHIIVSESTMTPDLLKDYIEPLGGFGANEDGLADAIRAEYGSTMAFVDKAIDDFLGGRGLDGVAESGRPLPKRSGLFIRPNRTRGEIANSFRVTLSNLPLPYAETEVVELDLEDVSFVKMLVHGNSVLEAFRLMMTTFSKPRFWYGKCLENTHSAVLQVALALKCHRLKTGELPESLDELVPEYFDAVPKDDIHGLPLKFSRKEKRVFPAVPEGYIAGADEVIDDLIAQSAMDIDF